MKLPLLSIITTSLNRRDLLRKTLDSVLAQNYPAIEQLVFDAASTDRTAELLREYEKKFSQKGYDFHWVSEKDSGQGEAMNKALKAAHGEFVMVLNSDDFLEENALKPFMDRLAEDSSIDFIYGNHDSLRDGRRETITHHPYSLEDILYRAYQIPQSAAIFRRSLIDRVGDFDPTLHYVAEHDLFLRMVKSGAKLAYLPAVLQITLEHPNRKATAGLATGWRETKKVNFRQGCGYFSRFYLLYVKNVYFGSFFTALQNTSPRAYQKLKNIFHAVSR